MGVNKVRGFDIVKDEHRQAYASDPTRYFINRVKLEKGEIFVPDIQLPTRADAGSAGYDFYTPINISLIPGKKTLVFTDVKAYMQEGEVLQLYIRSSLAVKHGLMLTNNVGIVDASYYGNEGNDGNIGIGLVNTSGKSVELKAGERIAQGIFMNYLTVDGDDTQGTRDGGFGSSGK